MIDPVQDMQSYQNSRENDARMVRTHNALMEYALNPVDERIMRRVKFVMTHRPRDLAEAIQLYEGE